MVCHAFRTNLQLCRLWCRHHDTRLQSVADNVLSPAVQHAGREPGIYSNADDFDKQLSKFPNAKGRRFHTRAEAQRFMKANGMGKQTVSAKTKQAITQAVKVRIFCLYIRHVLGCIALHFSPSLALPSRLLVAVRT